MYKMCCNVIQKWCKYPKTKADSVHFNLLVTETFQTQGVGVPNNKTCHFAKTSVVYCKCTILFCHQQCITPIKSIHLKHKMINLCLNIVCQGMESWIFTDDVCYRICRKANHRGRCITRSIREGSIFSRSHIPLPSWMTIMHRLGALDLSHATQMCFGYAITMSCNIA